MADYRLDLVPVDFCADALVALCGGDQTVYHLIAPQPLPLAELAAEVAPELSLMTDAAFSHLLQNKMLQEENEGLLALLEAYQHMRTVPMRIQTQSLSTQAALAASGFDWPAPNLRTILRAFF